jgi:hypothetical protein
MGGFLARLGETLGGEALFWTLRFDVLLLGFALGMVIMFD